MRWPGKSWSSLQTCHSISRRDRVARIGLIEDGASSDNPGAREEQSNFYLTP